MFAGGRNAVVRAAAAKTGETRAKPLLKKGGKKNRANTPVPHPSTPREFSARILTFIPQPTCPKDPKTLQPTLQSFVKIVRPAVSLVFRIACGFTNAPSRRPDPGRKYALCTFCT